MPLSCSRDERVCVPDTLLFKYNQDQQFRTETTGTGLFCILRDNCKCMATQGEFFLEWQGLV